MWLRKCTHKEKFFLKSFMFDKYHVNQVQEGINKSICSLSSYIAIQYQKLLSQGFRQEHDLGLRSVVLRIQRIKIENDNLFEIAGDTGSNKRASRSKLRLIAPKTSLMKDESTAPERQDDVLIWEISKRPCREIGPKWHGRARMKNANVENDCLVNKNIPV